MPFSRDSIMLPALLPVIVVHRTELPRLSLDYTRRARGGAATHVTLQRLNVQLRETRIDPAVRRGKRKALFSEQALVTADLLTLGRGEAGGRAGPAARRTSPTRRWRWTRSSWDHRSPMRTGSRHRKGGSDLIRFHLDSARFKGVDYRRLGEHRGRDRGAAARCSMGSGSTCCRTSAFPPVRRADAHVTAAMGRVTRSAAGAGHHHHRRRKDRLQRACRRPCQGGRDDAGNRCRPR